MYHWCMTVTLKSRLSVTWKKPRCFPDATDALHSFKRGPVQFQVHSPHDLTPFYNILLDIFTAQVLWCHHVSVLFILCTQCFMFVMLTLTTTWSCDSSSRAGSLPKGMDFKVLYLWNVIYLWEFSKNCILLVEYPKMFYSNRLYTAYFVSIYIYMYMCKIILPFQTHFLSVSFLPHRTLYLTEFCLWTASGHH